MPVLKTYKNGVWEPVSGMSEHTHTKNDITDLQEKVYTQPDEPVDAPVGAVWVDTDEDVGFGGSAGGGSASIDVTASVGQTIVVEEVDANGKPTKWKAADFQERTHWKERITKVSETEALFDSENGCFIVECGDLNFEAFKEYIITINGTEYVAVAWAADTGDVYVGNPIVLGEEDNGMSFFALSTDGMLMIVLLSGETEATVKVDTWQYTKIPPEYVNAGAFYINVANFGGGFTTTTTYNEAFNAQIADIPIIVRVTDDYAICTHIAGRLSSASELCFLGYTRNFDKVKVSLMADETADDYKTAPLIVTLTDES